MQNHTQNNLYDTQHDSAESISKTPVMLYLSTLRKTSHRLQPIPDHCTPQHGRRTTATAITLTVV